MLCHFHLIPDQLVGCCYYEIAQGKRSGLRDWFWLVFAPSVQQYQRVKLNYWFQKSISSVVSGDRRFDGIPLCPMTCQSRTRVLCIGGPKVNCRFLSSSPLHSIAIRVFCTHRFLVFSYTCLFAPGIREIPVPVARSLGSINLILNIQHLKFLPTHCSDSWRTGGRGKARQGEERPAQAASPGDVNNATKFQSCSRHRTPSAYLIPRPGPHPLDIRWNNNKENGEDVWRIIRRNCPVTVSPSLCFLIWSWLT